LSVEYGVGIRTVRLIHGQLIDTDEIKRGEIDEEEDEDEENDKKSDVSKSLFYILFIDLLRFDQLHCFKFCFNDILSLFFFVLL